MQAKLNKTLSTILLACVLAGWNAKAQVRHAPPAGINFLNKDWESALLLAKKMHKPIFVDAYTSWCAPCQEMRRTTFKDRRIAACFNAGFVNVAVDVEKGAGVEFADRYKVTAYPTLLFINADGSVIKRIEGFADAKALGIAAMDVK